MFPQVLVILSLALAGCVGKSSQPSATTSDTSTAGSSPATSSPPAPQGDSQATDSQGGVLPGQGASDPPAGSGSTGGATPASTTAPTSSASPLPTPTVTSTPTVSSTPTATSTPTSTPTVPPPPPLPGPPAQVTAACTVALTGLHGLAPIPATSGACSPATFVSSTGAAFTSLAVQVTQTATVLPAAALVQIKDASGTVIGTASGVGPLLISVPSALVPSTPSVPLTAQVALTGIFTDYSATVTFTLS